MGGIAVATQETKEESATEDQENREATRGGGACASPVEASLPASSINGLGHHGEPAKTEDPKDEEPQEGEEPGAEEEREQGPPAKLLRAPRTPSQSEKGTA